MLVLGAKSCVCCEAAKIGVLRFCRGEGLILLVCQFSCDDLCEKCCNCKTTVTEEGFFGSSDSDEIIITRVPLVFSETIREQSGAIFSTTRMSPKRKTR